MKSDQYRRDLATLCGVREEDLPDDLDADEETDGPAEMLLCDNTLNPAWMERADEFALELVENLTQKHLAEAEKNLHRLRTDAERVRAEQGRRTETKRREQLRLAGLDE